MKKTFTFHTRSRLWILCAAVCMVWAVPLHAQTRRISLNLKNATIQQAVIALQQQGYSLSVKEMCIRDRYYLRSVPLY